MVDVPSTQTARVRVLDTTRSQKNDPNDARSVAIVALRQPRLRLVAVEDHVAVLRMLAKRRRCECCGALRAIGAGCKWTVSGI